MEIWPGKAYPLGATYDGTGVNFALFSEVAEQVELCLFDDDGAETRVDAARGRRLRLARLPARRAARPALRLPRPRPVRPRRRATAATRASCCSTRTPRRSTARSTGTSPCSPTDFERPERRADKANTDDSLGHTMLSVVINPYFDWGHDRLPRHEYHETVIYEAHVKGLTETHPDIPEEIRGTYAGIAHPVIIEHLKNLGVTAIELMPVHQFVHDHPARQGPVELLGLQHDRLPRPAQRLRRRTARAASRCASSRPWSRRCTRPASRSSSTWSTTTPPRATSSARRCRFRGIDNAAYYRLVDDDKAHYYDTTGTGNSLLMRHPHVLQLIMDSLRYWVTEMHVDGFRFDLAATLARQFHEVDRLSAFFDLVQQDPVVSQVKLIAEPWDVGDGGYQVGNFPPLWTEWNGKYRDTVRDFWRGEAATLGEFASRLTGSSRPLRAQRPHVRSRRSTSSPPTTASRCATWCRTTRSTTRPTARTATTARATTARGTAASRARPTTPSVLALRARQQRNFLATLLLSPGRADAAARRRARPHPGRQQQRLLPGQRDLLGRLGRSTTDEPTCSSSPSGWSQLRRGPPGLPPPPVLRGRADHGGESRRRRHRLVPARRRAHGRRGLGRRLRPLADGVPQRRAPSPSRTRAASTSLDDSFLLLFNAHHDAIDVRPARRGVRRALGSSSSTPPPRRSSDRVRARRQVQPTGAASRSALPRRSVRLPAVAAAPAMTRVRR